MKIGKKVDVEYTVTLDQFDYEQLILALKIAYDSIKTMNPTPGNTKFAALHDELEASR